MIAGVWYWNSKTMTEQGLDLSTEGSPLPEVSEEDTTTAIQQDLEQIDLGDIEKQFQGIDADLNNL